jgi:hypothetical protein
MDEKKTERRGIFESIGVMLKEGIEKRKKEPSSLLYDATVLIISLLFSRCHIIFGAYPLSIAFVAVLPSGVWISLIGAIVGAMTLGRAGLIHAITLIIVVFLRIIIAGGDRHGERALFSEPLILRISSAAIGAFIGAAYEVLLRGFSIVSILYATASVLLSSVFTFAFSGVFDA